MNRREFLKLLGIGTTTIVTIGTGLWTPPLVGKHFDLTVLDDLVVDQRELLLHVIENVTPMDTLYYSEFAHVPRRNIVHHWLVDDIR